MAIINESGLYDVAAWSSNKFYGPNPRFPQAGVITTPTG